MATTTQIADAIKARLSAAFPNLAVEYFPDNPEKYRLNHPTGALLISYAGGRFTPSKSAGMVAQESNQVFSVVITARKLHGQGGAIALLDAVRPFLQSIRVPGCSALMLVSDQFLGETAGIWQYAVDVATDTMVVANPDPDPDLFLTQVNYVEE